MELYVYDSESVSAHGVIDEITSFIWTRRYWKAGEFKLLLPFTRKHFELLSMGRLIVKRGDAEAGEIKYIEIRKNSQGQEEIEVKGKFITGWIGKRIIENQIVMTDTAQNIICRILNENMPQFESIGQRSIWRLEIADMPVLRSGKIEYASEPYVNVLLACEAIAKASKLGFRIEVNVPGRSFLFSLYDGKDLTADQTENAPCVFSPELNNVVEQSYVYSNENYRNTIYLKLDNGGYYWFSNSEVDLQRDEVCVGAEDLKRTYTNSAGKEVTMSNDEYVNMLKQRAATEAENYTETISFNSKVRKGSKPAYKVDFDLGDRVTCVNESWGIKRNARITEITETYQKGTEEIEITFGESAPTLTDKIRQMTK